MNNREREKKNDEPTKPNPHEDEMHEHRRIGTEKRHQKYRREETWRSRSLDAIQVRKTRRKKKRYKCKPTFGEATNGTR